MKVLVSLTGSILVVVCVVLSCEKNDGTGVGQPQPIPPSNNRAPVANAGADLSLLLASCNDVASAELDGSGSSDPDGGSLKYRWTKIGGPENIQLTNATSVKANVQNMATGAYAFELMVNDNWGLLSRDTMRISVKGTAKQYDLDLTANGSFSFYNNELDYYSCYYGPCVYYDRVDIKATGTFAPLGTLNVFIGEYNDTVATSYNPETFISIYQGNVNSNSLYGTSSVNFKKLYQQGGGGFSGTLKVSGGSAAICDDAIFNNHPPLTLSGTIDLATGKASLRITGKSYF